jgi:lipopolysaccharide transport protein LptA
MLMLIGIVLLALERHCESQSQTPSQSIDALLPQDCEGQETSLDITSERMTFDRNTRTFLFENQVQIRRCNMTIFCDRLKVVGQLESGTAEQMVASGNVKIEYGTRRVTAERAEYLVAQQQIVLTGNPQAWDTHDRHQMTGEEIVVSLPQDHMIVKGARVRFHPRQSSD